MLWTLHEQFGDGTATAAVLFQSIYNQGVTYITAGGSAMMLRRHLEKGAQVVLDELTTMAMHVEGKEHLANIAASIGADPPLAKVLGEIFDVIGEYGQLEIRPIRSREVQREYIDGMFWNAKPFSREMIDRLQLKTELENTAVLISDLEIEDPRELVPVMTVAVEGGFRSLLIVANKLSAGAIGLLMANQNPEKFQTLAVRTPGPLKDDESAAMQDMAVLTGGRPFLRATKDTLDKVTLEDLGRARRAWADAEHFGIVGGGGDPRAVREHIRNLRAWFDAAHNLASRRKLQQRLGKLMGGAARLRVGGAAQVEIDARKALAEHTTESLRAAIREGVLPGGGVALLSCRTALKRLLDHSIDSDERAAYRILLKAMEVPARTIFHNAGYDASQVMAQVNLAPPGHGFDAVSGQVVDMAQAGIYDVAAVQKAAVNGAISTAALALTIDVLVHHKKPTEVPANP
jgi:chaperonin GroEL